MNIVTISQNRPYVRLADLVEILLKLRKNIFMDRHADQCAKFGALCLMSPKRLIEEHDHGRASLTAPEPPLV